MARKYEPPKPAPKTGEYRKLVCGALQFNNDSAVIHHTGLLAISEALEHAKKYPDQRLLVLSHTDKVDSDANNKKLSQQRAEAVLYLMGGGKKGGPTGNAIPWGKVCRERWITRDAQMILQWAVTLGWKRCNPLGAGEQLLTDKGDDKKAPLPQNTKRALFWFMSHYRAEYKATPDPMPTAAPTDGSVEKLEIDGDFWRAVYQLYWVKLTSLTMGCKSIDDLTAIANDVKFVAEAPTARSVGCGESCPLVDTEESSIQNRRTEFLFFTEGNDPPASTANYKQLYDKALFTVQPIKCKEKEPEIPVDTSAPNVVFVIDCSQSMDNKDGRSGGPESMRFGRCKTALTRAINDMLKESTESGKKKRFHIVRFSSGVGQWNPPGTDKAGVVLPLQDATTANVKSALDYIKNDLGMDGSTNTYAALERAFKVTDKVGGAVTEQVCVAFFSDGEPTVGERNTAKILTAVAGWRAATWKLDTYGFVFGDGGSAFTQFMQKLATENGGVFHPV